MHMVFGHIRLVDNITRLYLPKMSIVRLRVRDSHVHSSPYFIANVLGNSIKTLTDICLEGVTLWDGSRSWKLIMESLASMPSLQKCLLHDLKTAIETNRVHWYLVSFPRDEEACHLEGVNMRDNLEEIGRAWAQGMQDLLKELQEHSIDPLEQRELFMRLGHLYYARGIKIIVPNIQTQRN